MSLNLPESFPTDGEDILSENSRKYAATTNIYLMLNFHPMDNYKQFIDIDFFMQQA